MFWSALTCQRFSPVATCRDLCWVEATERSGRQAAQDQSADRSAHSKKGANYFHVRRIGWASVLKMTLSKSNVLGGENRR